MVENVDQDRVLISIYDKLRPLQPLLSGCCIYRVPENLRKVNEDAYRPWVVSIGPFYHNDAKLMPMQEEKLRYFQSFLKRTKTIDQCVQFVRERLQDIRNCYSQQMELDDDTFVEIVLLDATFIIEFLNRSVQTKLTEVDFIKNNRRYSMNLVFRDMILEENQLPFFVLNCIHNLTDLGERGIPFISLANVLAAYVKSGTHPIQYMPENTEIKHFVDMLRLYCLPLTGKTEPNHSHHNMTFSPSVTELHEAGLKFMGSTSENFLDISFNNGLLQIPRLDLSYDSEILFRNLMVFEQLHPNMYYYISDYITFLDGLINTTKDVDILVQSKIIYNWLGSNEEAAKLINSLGTHIMARGQNFYYSDLCNDLNKYKSSKWHKWRAILKSKYFSHPWAAISVGYAILLLILTILQVITGFIQIR